MADTNIAVATWLQRLAPDVTATVRRFPFAIVLAAFATATFLVGANVDQWLDAEAWLRLFIGFATGAVCAVAGVYFAESRPEDRRSAIVLGYALPVAVIALCQVSDTGWVVPFTLPAASILWLSVSAFTHLGHGAERVDQQHRFWWINQRAIATAALAGLSFAVIALGVVAIERSLSVLFGIESGDLFYRWVLPFVGLFLAPVYWLSTLPRVGDYEPDDMQRPDFVASAVGFLGEFVLAPFLGIYALILLAYTAQIAITQRLPEGTIGWMVLGFVVAGAATWLVLYPPFLDRKPLVRLFRRAWFWVTLIPLALFFLAVWIRVDAYGLTTERLLLVSGGVWAAILAVVFLIGRGDIRLIPALAGGVLLAFSFGPWSYLAWPDHDQGARLSRLLADVKDPTATVSQPDWDAAEQAAARGAIGYLLQSDHGRATLERVLLDHGFVWEGSWTDPAILMRDLGYPDSLGQDVVSYAARTHDVPIDVSATPFYIGHQEIWPRSVAPHLAGFNLTLSEAGALEVYRDGKRLETLDLASWAAKQHPDRLAEPWIDFSAEGANYRIVLTSATWRSEGEGASARIVVTGLVGLLFADSSEVSIPRP